MKQNESIIDVYLFVEMIKGDKGTFRRQEYLTSSTVVSLIGLNVQESSGC